MSELISESVQKARKEHRCEDCDQPIFKGETYTRQFVKDCGDTWTYKAHSDCLKVSWEMFRHFGLSYGDEWLGMATQSSEDWEWRKSIAAYLREKPEYAAVRRRMVLTRLRWRQSRKEWLEKRSVANLKRENGEP